VHQGGFDERSRAFGLQAEVPSCYYAAAEPEQGIVILDDLTSRGAEFGEATNLWSTDSVAETLEVQASWNGPLGGSTKGRYEWLPIGAEAARQAFQVMLSPEQFHP
jgi:hypothetical protein